MGISQPPALAVLWILNMRVNLNVKYEDRHEAKRLGARWDISRHTWYVKDVEDLEPFLRWITPGRLLLAQEGQLPTNRGRPRKPRFDSKPGVATPRTDSRLPDCGCTHIAPWEHCEHTASM